MRQRIVDKEISQAWLQAAKDLGIRVEAPFTLRTPAGDCVAYEARILDFGGPKGTVVGVLNDNAPWKDIRKANGYYGSNLAPSYRQYDRKLFIDTLNDWQWFGENAFRPLWYTGKSWS